MGSSFAANWADGTTRSADVDMAMPQPLSGTVLPTPKTFVGCAYKADKCPRSPFGANAELSLRDWLLQRVRTLNVDLDAEILWTILNEIKEDQFGDEQVLKMWLGYPPE